MKTSKIKTSEISEINKISEKERKLLHKTLIRKKKNKILNVLTLADVEKGIEIPNIPFKNKHDKVEEVIILMAYLGLRVDEAMNFDWNTAFKKNKKLIGFKVVGKGNKERLVYNVFYNDYITLKASLIRNKEIEHIDYDITRFGIRGHLNAKSEKLNWKGKVNPHDFRRAFASGLLYEKEANRELIQELLGHAFSSTTEKYLRKDPRAMDDMLDRYMSKGE